MNKKIFILLSFLIVLISVSAVSAVDLDDNNETVVTSEIGETQLSVSQDVNAIDDLNEDDADSDVVLENTVKSSVAGENEILGVGYTAEGDSDSDVLSEVLIPVRLDLEINKFVGVYMNLPDWPSLNGYIQRISEIEYEVSRGTLSVYINGELKGTVGPDDGWVEVPLGPLAVGTYTIRAVYHDGSGIYGDGEFTQTITIDKANTEITIEQDSIELDAGDKISTGATLSLPERIILPDNITLIRPVAPLSPSEAGALIYSSSDPEVAEVVNNSIVAKKAGSATITVSYNGNQNYTAADNQTIKVTVNEVKTPTSIDIANSTVNLKVNDEIATGATLTPADAGNLTYTSSNSSVAVVKNGKIKALAVGSTNITVSFAGDDTYAAAENKTIAVTVTLNEANWTYIGVSGSERELDGDIIWLPWNYPPICFVKDVDGVGLPEGTKITILCEGDKNYVINTTTAKNGQFSVDLSSVELGTYEVTFSTEGYTTATTNVYLIKVPTEITVDNSTVDLKVNDEIPSGATLTPADAGNLTYTSSNPGVAVVENGKIKALAVGSTNITVSFVGDDKYFAAENKTIGVTVTLNDACVSVNNATLGLLVDDEFIVVVTTNPEGLDVTFTSDNSGVVRVDENGVITALKEGEASVKVSVGGDGVYALNTTDVSVTVSKIPTEIIVDNSTLNMKIGDIASDVARLEPATGDNLNYTSSDPNVVKVEDDKLVAITNGTAVVIVSYEGNDKYEAAMDTVIVVNVSLKDASVSVLNDTVSIIIDEVYEIDAIVVPDTLNVTYESDNPEVASVDNGVVYGLKEGTAVITLTVGDGKNYAINSTTVTVTVSKVATEIILNNATLDMKIGDSAEDVAVLKPITGDNLTYTSSDPKVVKVEDGKLVAVGAGEASVTVSYAGNDKYAPSNATVSVKVSKFEIKPEIKQNDTTLTVSVPEDATGDVTVAIGNETITSPIEDGIAVIDLSDVPAGDYNATVSYPGDSKYSGFEVVSPVSIESEFQLIAENLTKYYHGTERFAVKALDGKGNPMSGVEVIIFVNGMTYTRVTDENGSASIGVNLESGVFIATVSCNNTTVEATITVLTTVNGTDLVKVFRNETQYYATFRDSEGNYLKEGTNVRFNIHGVMYDRQISGDKGLAKLNINLEQGEYIITAINLETGESRANNITVLSRIVENYDLTKYYRNESQYTVKLIGDDGNPVGAGENVTFNINGVFYTRTTNESGIAKLNINLQEGDYVITAGYKECMVSNKIKVLPVLTAKDLTKKYGTKDQFVASLVDGQGKAYAGQNIQFNINGVFYNRVTDSNGQAKLNINLQPGKYIITSSYNGANIGNTVTVTA